ncbi:hypothetical protein ACFO6R_10270 [Eubacterium multiforme]|uniref:Helix-turn-helix domain-containing protein n=1 Tax=Eubacterium multiforme TaxID=83339 RepID=A0ABT9USN3_9FIRM|nr:hypothetical protein [Eubacterium multiforme]MDQ0149331.1 hypothetical protein [Eubacterium multiforme]
MDKKQLAYKYLINKYSEAPNIEKYKIQDEIRRLFELEDKEVKTVYYTWKQAVIGTADIPTKQYKDIKAKERKKYQVNIEELKVIFERYKNGEKVDDLSKEVDVSIQSLLYAFRYYKRKGILKGRKKKKITIDGKIVSEEEMKKIIKRLDAGEVTKEVAEELGVKSMLLRSAYGRYKKRFRGVD